MRVERDFEDFIRLLNENRVKYLLVGAFAVGFHSRPWSTGEMDLLVQPEKENASRVLKVLRDFGFGSLDITIETLCDPNTVVQLGFEPNRIDLITSIGDFSFEDAYAEKSSEKYGESLVDVISYDFLLRSKRIANRPRDIADIDQLTKFRKIEEEEKKKRK